MKLTKLEYDKKFNIDKKILKNLNIFKPGEKVMYYIGDRQVSNLKWRQRWSGPWTILQRLNDRTLIISDSKDDVSRRVTIDRVKIYNNKEYICENEYNKKMRKRIKFNDK